MVIAVGGEVHPFTPWGGKIWKIVKIRHGKNKITNGNGAIIALTSVKRNRDTRTDGEKLRKTPQHVKQHGRETDGEREKKHDHKMRFSTLNYTKYFFGIIGDQTTATPLLYIYCTIPNYYILYCCALCDIMLYDIIPLLYATMVLLYIMCVDIDIIYYMRRRRVAIFVLFIAIFVYIIMKKS